MEIFTKIISTVDNNGNICLGIINTFYEHERKCGSLVKSIINMFAIICNDHKQCGIVYSSHLTSCTNEDNDVNSIYVAYKMACEKLDNTYQLYNDRRKRLPD